MLEVCLSTPLVHLHLDYLKQCHSIKAVWLFRLIRRMSITMRLMNPQSSMCVLWCFHVELIFHERYIFELVAWFLK
jgi:hypothetical protein